MCSSLSWRTFGTALLMAADLALVLCAVVANVVSVPVVLSQHAHARRALLAVDALHLLNGRRAVAEAALRASRFRIATVALATGKVGLLAAIIVYQVRPARLSGYALMFVVLVGATHLFATFDAYRAEIDRRRILRAHPPAGR